MAVTTLPRSGPSCAFDTCVTYPYTDITEYFPRDYYWMIPATVLLAPYVMLLAYIHVQASENKKAFSLASLAFGAMSTAVLASLYFTQLTVVNASLDRGETDGLSLISQYNPHGLFIAGESVGYLLMSLGFLSLAAVFDRGDRLTAALRWVFLLASVAAFVFLIVLISIHGSDLEYRFEIAVISINWTTLILGGFLLSVRYWKEQRRS